MRKRLLVQTVFAVLFLAGATSSGYGAGYGIFVQGASALGEADATVAHGEGPSVLFFNPALMVGLPGSQAEVGTTFIVPERKYTDPGGRTTEGENRLYTPSTLYLTQAVSDRLSAGLAVFNPFGLGTRWPDDWEGRYIATDTNLTTTNINPSLAYRVAPWLSIAGGVDLLLLDAGLEKKINTAPLLGLPSGTADSTQKFTGDGYGLGYNVGVLLEPTRRLALGVHYRSEVEVDVKGEAQFDLAHPALAEAFPDTGARTTITLPQQLFAGVAWRITDRWTAEGSARWEDWTAFPEFGVRFEEPVGGSREYRQPRQWDDTLSFMVGTRYRLNEHVALLGGYLYGPDAVPASTFEPAIPAADSHLFTVGTDLTFEHLTVSLAYGLQSLEKRQKENAVGDPVAAQGGIISGTANGTYESTLHLAAVSVTYRF